MIEYGKYFAVNTSYIHIHRIELCRKYFLYYGYK